MKVKRKIGILIIILIFQNLLLITFASPSTNEYNLSFAPG